MDTDPKLVLDQFREFLIYCKERLGLKKLPKIHWHINDDVGVTRPSFGSFENDTQEIKIGINNRHPLDIMRTLAHELTHYKQFLNGELHSGSGETGSPAENEANAMAGIIMRDWNAAHEEMFKQDEIDEAAGVAKINLNKTKDGKAAKWVKHVYDTLPSNPMNPDQVVLVYGEGEDQGLALIELEPDRYDADTANIKWIQTYPQRKGIGRDAIKDLQQMAAEAGVNLSLTAWKHGKVPERVLKKFYKSMGFGQDTKSGQMKWTVPITETAADDIPQEVWEFLDTLHADDVGKERIGDYVVHFEGFTDVCQADAEERLELPPTDPRHLDKYDDVYDEVIADFIGREAGNKPAASGLVGDDLYPVVYAVFHKEVLDESNLNRIDQFEYDGGSLEGYVVDTDQPQLENYLTAQGASIDLVKALQSRYRRIGLVRNMWVDEEMRGGGIGSDMLEKAIGDAFAFGADAILLVADMAEDNSQLGKPLDKWYEGWGFKTIGGAGGDPVMVLDKGLTESWSKKYKKSIDCNHPKGFSQRAHCAGRRARQAGKKTKSKSVSEQLIDDHKLLEARDAFLAYVKQKFPHMPDYVAYELIYKNSKMDPTNVTEIWSKFYGSYIWKLVNNFKVNESIWDSETSDRIRNRLGTPGDNDTFPKDKERFAQQRAMIQQRGISQEPIIVEESREEPGKYTLLEGWHRTIEALRAYPKGYTCPAYVGSPTATTEKIRAKAPASFWQKLKQRVLGENFADGKGPGRPGDSQRYGIPKGATIAQLEKASKAPGRKGQLARWQLNMRRGRAKNESIIDEGKLAFHSSAQPGISKFNSFSHFGTEKAAVDRIKNLVKQKRIKPDTLITVYSVDLNLKNPLMIKDNANINHSAGHYALALRDAKIIDQDTMYRIRINNPYELADPEDDPEKLDKLWPKYEKNNLATIKKILKSKGYDGLVYKNASEDKGSLSYVILDPNQVRITGKKQVPARELIKSINEDETAVLDKPTPTVGDLAEKYHTSLLAVKQQLVKGIKVEMEHTSKKSVAKEIALDHLGEDLFYYKKLAKVEKK